MYVQYIISCQSKTKSKTFYKHKCMDLMFIGPCIIVIVEE